MPKTSKDNDRTEETYFELVASVLTHPGSRIPYMNCLLFVACCCLLLVACCCRCLLLVACCCRCCCRCCCLRGCCGFCGCCGCCCCCRRRRGCCYWWWQWWHLFLSPMWIPSECLPDLQQSGLVLLEDLGRWNATGRPEYNWDAQADEFAEDIEAGGKYTLDSTTSTCITECKE